MVKHPRTIVILNHATPLSWIPAISFLTQKVVAAGGGDRKPLGVADKWLFSNPFTKPLAEYLTQSDRHLSFEKLMNSEALNLPLFMHKIPRFGMSCELYWPTLKAEELATDWTERKEQLDIEGEKIRQRMSELLLPLDFRGKPSLF